MSMWTREEWPQSRPHYAARSTTHYVGADIECYCELCKYHIRLLHASVRQNDRWHLDASVDRIFH